METPEEAAILEELAVKVALQQAADADIAVICYATRNEYIDRLHFSFTPDASRDFIVALLHTLTGLGNWLPESVRWRWANGYIHTTSMVCIRSHRR